MSNRITLQIDGSVEQEGHLLVADFLQRLEHLLGALNGIDCIVGQSSQPTLNYRIVDASHSSPLTITLEPVIRRKVIVEGTDHIERRNRRFFSEMNAIRSGAEISPEIDEGLLDHFRKLVEGIGTDFTAARIHNSDASVELDREFDSKVRQLLDEEDASYGGEEGMLEAVNLHGKKKQTFWIYPRIGAKKIRCEFLPGMRDQIKQNLGMFVRVEGMKFFRPHSPFPFRISVKDLIPIGEESAIPLSQIKGIAPRATGDMPATDFIRKLRDEWD